MLIILYTCTNFYYMYILTLSIKHVKKAQLRSVEDCR